MARSARQEDENAGGREPLATAPAVTPPRAPGGSAPTNAEIADALDRVADLLEAQDANRFRVRAYREGARTVRAGGESIAQLARRPSCPASARAWRPPSQSWRRRAGCDSSTA